MGRMMPTECPHGAIIDWGDFGCQEDECYGTCDLCPPESCAVCNPTPGLAELATFTPLTAQEASAAWQAARIAELEAELVLVRSESELRGSLLNAIKIPIDDPVPYLPVDPEEQRRLTEPAADGSRCMIYRSNG